MTSAVALGERESVAQSRVETDGAGGVCGARYAPAHPAVFTQYVRAPVCLSVRARVCVCAPPLRAGSAQCSVANGRRAPARWAREPDDLLAGGPFNGRASIVRRRGPDIVAPRTNKSGPLARDRRFRGETLGARVKLRLSLPRGVALDLVRPTVSARVDGHSRTRDAGTWCGR